MDLFRQEDQDDEVIKLLGRLKEAAPEYPPRLFAARRAAVLGAFVALPLGGLAAASWFAHLLKTIKAMALIDKIILAAEVVAVTGLTAYGAATAYVYRREIKQLLFPAPTASSSNPIPSLSVLSPVPATEAYSSETPPASETPLVAATPMSPAELTAAPPAGAPAPTHGLHLGQTKTPNQPDGHKTPKGP